MNKGKRIRSALFVDFDNTFSSLLQIDRRAAFAFADDPVDWLDGLRSATGLEGTRRDLLVCRAYLNPAGWIIDPERGNDAKRVPLGRFRAPLTNAGFEVIDCPPLTAGQKNAADIRMVVDILDALTAPVTYDEFIVASSDADFTPLLQRLRAMDRRTVIMACGPSSSAYRNVADTILDAEAVVSLLGADDVVDADSDESSVGSTVSGFPAAPSRVGATATTVPPVAASNGSRSDTATLSGPASAEPTFDRGNRAMVLVRQQLDASDGPLQLARIGMAVREQLGSKIVESTKWFGRSTLSKFIKTNLPDIAVHRQWAWIPAQHAAPEEFAGGSEVTAMPEVVGRLHRAAGLPRLPTGHWPVLFDTFIEYAKGHEFQMAECSKWVRDKMVRKGFPMSRASVNFVIVALASNGVRLDSGESPTRVQCRDGFMRSLTDRAAATGWELDDREWKALAQWFDAVRIAPPTLTAP